MSLHSGASSHTRRPTYGLEDDQCPCDTRADGPHKGLDDTNTPGDPGDDYYGPSGDALSDPSGSGFSHDKDVNEAISDLNIINKNGTGIAAMTSNTGQGGDSDVNETPSDPGTFYNKDLLHNAPSLRDTLNPHHNVTATDSNEDDAGDNYNSPQSSHLTSDSDEGEGSDPRSCSSYSSGDEEENFNNVATSPYHAMNLSPGSIVQRKNDDHPFVISRTAWNENGEQFFWGNLFTSRPKSWKLKEQYERPGPGKIHYIYIGGKKPNEHFNPPEDIKLPTVSELDMEGPPMRLRSYIVIEECGPYKRDDFVPHESQQHRLSHLGVEKLLSLSTVQPSRQSLGEATHGGVLHPGVIYSVVLPPGVDSPVVAFPDSVNPVVVHLGVFKPIVLDLRVIYPVVIYPNFAYPGVVCPISGFVYVRLA